MHQRPLRWRLMDPEGPAMTYWVRVSAEATVDVAPGITEVTQYDHFVPINAPADPALASTTERQ